MLLKHLKENVSTSTSALDQLLYNANKLAVLYSGALTDQINNLYAEGNHEDMYRTAKTIVGRTKGRWFAENYLSTSSRRDSPTSGLKNALMALSKDPKFAKSRPGLIELGSLEIYGNAEQRREKESSFGQHLTRLEALPDLLLSLSQSTPEYADRLKTTAARLRNAIAGFKSTWERNHVKWDNEWGKQADINKANAKKQQSNAAEKQVTGVQRSQSGELINQVLSSLDRKVAADIRSSIARSDNKLLALQQELTKRGISL